MIMFLVELLQHSAVLFVIIVGFTPDFVRTEDGRICDDRREVCYFKVTTEEKNWMEANDLCRIENATLPVILNKTEQIEFESILSRFERSNKEVWTSGKEHSNGSYTWINGRPFNRSEKIYGQHELRTQMALTSNLVFTAVDPRQSYYYLCKCSGEICNSSETFSQPNGCLKKSDDRLPWYDARNKCLHDGGDLAVLENENRTILSKWLTGGGGGGEAYMIGLRNRSIRWSSSTAADIDDEIKYSNFRYVTDSPLSSNLGCISIRFSDGQWNVVNCKNQKKVICQRRQVSVSTHSITPTTLFTPLSTHNTGMWLTVPVAVVAVAIFIVICIIIIVVVVMKRSGKSPRRADKPHRRTDAEQDGQNTTKGHKTDIPNYNEEQTATDNQCHYAEIPAKPLSGPEASESNPRPDIVYATMDFQNEPAYDEAKSTSVNLNVGQHGDQALYAVPYAENGAKQRGNTMSDQPTYGNVVKTKVGH